MIKRFFIAAAVILTMTMAAFADNGRPVKVACIGNSITFGFLVEPRETMNYPAQLGRMLGPGYEVGNFGHSGATLLFKGHNPYVRLPEWKDALAFRPDIAVIHLGVNDTDPRDWPDYGDQFVENYSAIIDSLREVNPDMRILIARLTPLSAKHYRFRSGTRDWRKLVIDAIDRVGELKGVEVIDFSTPLIDRQNLLIDGIHPDANGATVLAETVRKAITGNYGGLQLPEVFGDNMVLQRYRPITVNGHADAGAVVTATLGGNTASALTDNRGNFSLTLPPMKEAEGLVMTVTDGKTERRFSNVAVGEVWIASGQSNMEFMNHQTITFKADSAMFADAGLRLFNMKPRVITNSREWSEADKDSLDKLVYYKPAEWKPSSYRNASDFSAVAWYFAKSLRDSLNVPVGVICNAIGGSGTEAWVDVETLENGMPEVLLNWRRNDYLQPWVQQRAGENTGLANPLRRHPYEPSYLFSTGIRPLGAYPVAGVIWYQGESNAHNIEVHEGLFRLLVESWRNYWQQPELPFVFAQLSSIDRPSWPVFRNSQRLLASEIPNSAMVVTSDWGDSLDVHPRNKRPVGERFARQALNRVYSMTQVTPSGPLPVKAERTAPGTIELTMEYGEGMHSSDGAPLRTFEIAEIDGKYYPATATVVGPNRIKLTNMDITTPRYARYAWQPFTRANLVNEDELPASTFVIAVTETPEREEGIDCGVSAAYAGIADGTVIRAGGCNFPSNPMAPGAQKKFYSGIYAIETIPAGITTRLIGHLPEGMAYGCGVTTPQGLAIIGGTDANGALSTVWMLNVGADGKAVLSPLPSLPAAIDNMAACYADGKIYVAGGNVDGQPSNSLFALNLSDTAAGWKQLKNFPGNPRVQPVLAASSATGKTLLYLWGGFAGRGEGREPSLDTDGLCFNPANGKWTSLPAPVDPAGQTLSTGGGTAVTLPSGDIMVMGGVNKDVFLEALRNQAPDYLSHPVEWYRFNNVVSVFSPKSGKWTIVDQTDAAARAGAVSTLTVPGDAVLLIGGEIKPRIRTADILSVPVK
ncbi:MAG: cyclically-permuted mutarotase family protein [Paramuribaculum sp.]|nr:cyclically-permuted mutarotase family protein [Paramuribaculum sp.]